jgi:signal transduction histidine kinase
MSEMRSHRYGDRTISRMTLFWCVVVVALLAVNSVQVAVSRPSILHTADGPLTAALVLGYGAWFLYLMTLRTRRRDVTGFLLRRTQLYLLLGAGLALTAALVVLHSEYVGLAFADIGIVVFATDGWISIVPVAFLGGLFLYATGAVRSGTLPQLGSELLTLVSTVALIYTVAAVIRQRVERDRLIAELQEAHRQLRLASARDVELAALRERNRLAREMHDSLGRALVLIAIKIEAAQRLHAVDPDRAAAEWEATKALVRSTMSDLRSSLAGLRLVALDEQPFRIALAGLALDLERSANVAVTVDVPDEADALDRTVQEALYRVAQEALANVAKHAHARHAWLSLTLDNGVAALLVEDDGVGLAAASPALGAHFGVVGMRERVEGLAGRFTLAPRPNGGVRLRADVPIPVEEGGDVRHSHPVG